MSGNAQSAGKMTPYDLNGYINNSMMLGTSHRPVADIQRDLDKTYNMSNSSSGYADNQLDQNRGYQDELNRANIYQRQQDYQAKQNALNNPVPLQAPISSIQPRQAYQQQPITNAGWLQSPTQPVQTNNMPQLGLYRKEYKGY